MFVKNVNSFFFPGGAVVRSVDCATPGEEVPGSIPAALLVNKLVKSRATLLVNKLV